MSFASVYNDWADILSGDARKRRQAQTTVAQQQTGMTPAQIAEINARTGMYGANTDEINAKIAEQILKNKIAEAGMPNALTEIGQRGTALQGFGQEAAEASVRLPTTQEAALKAQTRSSTVGSDLALSKEGRESTLHQRMIDFLGPNPGAIPDFNFWHGAIANQLGNRQIDASIVGPQTSMMPGTSRPNKLWYNSWNNLQGTPTLDSTRPSGTARISNAVGPQNDLTIDQEGRNYLDNLQGPSIPGGGTNAPTVPQVPGGTNAPVIPPEAQAAVAAAKARLGQKGGQPVKQPSGGGPDYWQSAGGGFIKRQSEAARELLTGIYNSMSGGDPYTRATQIAREQGGDNPTDPILQMINNATPEIKASDFGAWPTKPGDQRGGRPVGLENNPTAWAGGQFAQDVAETVPNVVMPFAGSRSVGARVAGAEQAVKNVGQTVQKVAQKVAQKGKGLADTFVQDLQNAPQKPWQGPPGAMMTDTIQPRNPWTGPPGAVEPTMPMQGPPLQLPAPRVMEKGNFPQANRMPAPTPEYQPPPLVETPPTQGEMLARIEQMLQQAPSKFEMPAPQLPKQIGFPQQSTIPFEQVGETKFFPSGNEAGLGTEVPPFGNNDIAMVFRVVEDFIKTGKFPPNVSVSELMPFVKAQVEGGKLPNVDPGLAVRIFAYLQSGLN